MLKPQLFSMKDELHACVTAVWVTLIAQQEREYQGNKYGGQAQYRANSEYCGIQHVNTKLIRYNCGNKGHEVGVSRAKEDSRKGEHQRYVLE